MSYQERNRDTTPDLLELLEQVQQGKIIERRQKEPQMLELLQDRTRARRARSSRAPSLDELENE